VKWSPKSGHRVKAVKCHNEVNDDNLNPVGDATLQRYSHIEQSLADQSRTDVVEGADR
jgi:hypothetical protein